MRALVTVPFSDETLTACAGTHLLFPGAPLSLVDLRSQYPDLFYPHQSEWYGDGGRKRWAAARCDIRWHLLRTDPVPRSRGKTFQEQAALLSSEEEIPRACEVVTALVLHCRATGERLLKRCYVRCRDQGRRGRCITVGSFDREGLIVSGNHRPNDHDGGIGVAASRKF